jgi:dTDP-4-amino-4,6-dideoxygalactose transaminase
MTPGSEPAAMRRRAPARPLAELGRRARRQPPAHSPLTLRAVWRAWRAAATATADPRQALARRLSCEYEADRTILFGSGTQALQVAVTLALRAARGSTVALPAFTCFDVAAAAVGANARVEVYDLDPATLCPDLESLDRALERGACAAVVSPLYGFPVDWDLVAAVAARRGAVLIEDAAQGFGATWRGRPVGSLGVLSVLSFGRGKGWTGGAGGALLLRGPAGAWDTPLPPPASWLGEARVRARLLGQWAFARPALYGVPAALPWLRLGETVYREPGPLCGMTRAAAACLGASRVAAERETATRRAHGLALLAAIGDAPCARPVRPLAQGVPSFLRFPVRVACGLEGLCAPAAARRLGVQRGYPRALATLPEVSARLPRPTDRTPGAEELVRTLITVPTHSLLTLRERGALAALLSGGAAP